MFNENEIKRLTGLNDVMVLEETDSTNTFLKKCAEAKEEGAIVIAKKQTAGRGRLGRSFVSEKNGLYMSVLLKPENDPDKIMLITAMAAVAVLRAVKALGVGEPKIKWVNDIFVNDKKVAGILTEGVFKEGKLDYAVLGIGVNLVRPEGGMDKSISPIATYLLENADDGNRFTADIINNFFSIYRGEEFLSEYRSNSLLDGKMVAYFKDDVLHTATVLGIDDKCGLILNENGERVILKCGEVSVKGC
jgi:BirA family biotin operon repressor/biotin-[acetyl-CoA-carboxylase] ligase